MPVIIWNNNHPRNCESNAIFRIQKTFQDIAWQCHVFSPEWICIAVGFWSTTEELANIPRLVKRQQQWLGGSVVSFVFFSDYLHSQRHAIHMDRVMAVNFHSYKTPSFHGYTCWQIQVFLFRAINSGRNLYSITHTCPLPISRFVNVFSLVERLFFILNMSQFSVSYINQ